LLEEVSGLLAKKGYRLVNVDTVIIAQAPRLGPHLAAMGARMAEVLKVDRATVNVKVKSGEHLDAIGREEAIAAQAVCLIEAI
jgi:2-C-methyl-D-erythritol 2,4-cyclodiphosphate synthase